MKLGKIKRPFLVFSVGVSLLTFAAVMFIQSSHFAVILKTFAARYIPKDLGVEADFSELSIKFFPPGFSIRNPKIALGKRNIAGLPEGSSVVAKSIDFTFRPLQVFSGNIRIHEVTVVDGMIDLILTQSGLNKKSQDKQSQGKQSKFDFHWDELFNIRAESIALQRTDFHLRFSDAPETLSAHADTLRLSQRSGKGGLGYGLDLDVKEIKGSLLNEFGMTLPVDRIHGGAYVNALGLQLESLSVFEDGLEATASGSVKGNFLGPKSQRNLKTDLNLNLRGDLRKLLTTLKITSKQQSIPEGFVSFSGKVQGNPEKALQSFQADGELTIRNFSYQKWTADLVNLEAGWDASPTGGVVELKHGLITSAEKPRIGGEQPGDGGKVEIGPTKFVIGSPAPFAIPLSFKDAHLHWLAAIALKGVYPLDLRLNGKIDAKVTPPAKGQPWEVRADLASWVENFRLDNQRLHQQKPLKTVFSVPRIGLDGQVRVDSTGVFPQNLVVSMPHTKLHTGGKIDFKKGYDLSASGPIDLEDLKQIAENDVRGKGTVNVRVHGPTSRVFVDVDLAATGAYYLKLFLGDLKGRVTWDDDPQNLIFDRVTLTKNTTHYTVDGQLDLGKSSTANLDVRIPQGNIQDFIQIFSNLTHSFWWFPESLRGGFSGSMKISGGISLSELAVGVELNGSNWGFFDERLKSVYLSGGYLKGKYYVDDFRGLKQTGRMSGAISYGSDGFLEWGLETRDFVLSDLDFVSRLDVPMRGRLSIRTSGQGTIGNLSSETDVSLNEFSVRGVGLAPSQMSLKVKNGVAKVAAQVMGGQGVVDASYDFHPQQLSTIRAELKQLDFTPILLLLNSKSIQDSSLKGTVSGSTQLSFHAGSAEKANGTITISDYLLARSNARFETTEPLSFKVVDGSFEIPSLVLRGKSGETTLALKGRSGQIEGTVVGDLDTSILEFFASSVSQATGLANLNLAIGGSLKMPTLFGRVSLGGTSLRVSSLDSAFENVTGTLTIKQNVLNFQDVAGDLGGGRVKADGRVVLYSDRYPGIYIKGLLNGPKLKIYPFQFVKAHGNLQVHGESPPYQVDGQVKIESAISKEKVFSRKQTSQGLKAAQYAPPPTRQAESGLSKFHLNIDVDAPKGIIIQNDLFRDVELKCNLTVVNTMEAPRILGRADVISGKLLFKDHVFQIQNATANFDTPTAINPILDLNANTEVNRVKIQMFASGRQDKLKFELTSNPAMQESEILSLLTMGLTSADAKKLNASDLSVVQQGEAASLVLHSLDFNRDLEDKTGFQVKLDETVNTQQGVNAFRPQGDAIAAPQITIRRNLGDRLSLSAGSTVGIGTNKASQVNLDFSVNPDISITGVFNNYGTFGTADNQTIQNSGGFDLKFQKRFK